jgi:cytochrome c oxidase subunit II
LQTLAGIKRASILAVACFCVAGCTGPQSAFTDAGDASQVISRLFYWMVGGAVVIWLIVVGGAVYAVRSQRTYDLVATRRIIIGGGAIFPTVVLAGLLSYGLALMPRLQSPAPEGSLTVQVDGVRWWWRVRSLDPDAHAIGDTVIKPSSVGGIDLANEIVLPVNEPVEFKLSSEDVIHAFWIPALGGKIDMIPGRHTRLKLLPLKTGSYRGVCAEYCGEAHTQMAFTVRVVSREEFDRWINGQREPVQAAVIEAHPGWQVFRTRGCGACHTLRGTIANGVVGPDLTHVGSRGSIGAGWLENDVENFKRWLMKIKSIKPGVEMPQFDSLTEVELQQLAEFLEGLQ